LATRAFRVGITGKIGSGKSTLSEVFRSHGITVLDADSIAKDAMNSDDELKKQLTQLLGEDAYTNGLINREVIAEKIFHDATLKSAVESVVHPATLRHIKTALDKAKPGEIICLESAILLQTGLDELFDMLILVKASDENIIKWLLPKGRFSEEDIRARLAVQGYDDISDDDADMTISNESTIEDFKKRCELTIQLVKIAAMQELPESSLRTVLDNGVEKSGG
jgi:dephospho-CoA kinase